MIKVGFESMVAACPGADLVAFFSSRGWFCNVDLCSPSSGCKTPSAAQFQGPFDYEQADVRGRADLASSFAALMSRLNSELAGRDLVLREAKDMVRRETRGYRVCGPVVRRKSTADFPSIVGKSGLLEQAIADLSDIPETEASGGTLLNWRWSVLMLRLSTGTRAFFTLRG